MQIIEESIIGVRSAVITLSRRDTPLKFVLFPMIHSAAPEFYREVTRRLRDCDLIVAEGAGMTAGGLALTLSYRLARHNRRMGVETQSLDLLALGKPIVIPDISAEDFRRGWRDIPLLGRVAFMLGAPLFGLWTALFGTRQSLGKHLALDDLPSRDDELLTGDAVTESLEALLVDQRDKLLVEQLLRIHDERMHEPLRVAVVYGAQHMRTVSAALHAAHRYRPRDAEWITVLAY